VVILQLQGRARVQSKQIFINADEASDWQSALALLENALQGSTWKKADVEVILSNHFVRYLVLPWNAASLSDAEQMLLVRHRFDEVYGEGGENWALRLSEGAFGSPSLASAIPQAMLDSIKVSFQSLPLHLTSVQPYLMTVFNACRRELGKQDGWFVLAERDTFCVGLLQDGHWHSIRARRVVNDWFEEAMLLLEREILLANKGDQFDKVFLYAPDGAGAASFKRGALQIQRLQPSLRSEFTPTEMSLYAMATAGL
jgi:hypothetical protein